MKELSVAALKQADGSGRSPSKSPASATTERSSTWSPIATPQRGLRPGIEKTPVRRKSIEILREWPICSTVRKILQRKVVAIICKPGRHYCVFRKKETPVNTVVSESRRRVSRRKQDVVDETLSSSATRTPCKDRKSTLCGGKINNVPEPMHLLRLLALVAAVNGMDFSVKDVCGVRGLESLCYFWWDVESFGLDQEAMKKLPRAEQERAVMAWRYTASLAQVPPSQSPLQV